jgi:hypothetical protein
MSEIGAVLSEIDIILGFRVAVWQWQLLWQFVVAVWQFVVAVAVWQWQFVVAVAM